MTRGLRLLSVLPCFVVPDVEAAARHYHDRLGFRVCGVYGDKPEQFGIVDRAPGQGFHFKSAVTCVPGAAPSAGTPVRGRRNRLDLGGGQDAYVRVADADRLHADLLRRGARILSPPTDQPWMQREFEVQDDDGFVLCFGGDTSGAWPADGFMTSPEFVVADIARTAAFYRDRLGFTRVKTYFDPPRYAIASRGGATLHFSLVSTPQKPVSNCAAAGVWDACVEVVGVDALAAEFRGRGVPLVRGPVDTFYGAREIEVADPDGFHIVFSELEDD